MEILANLLLLHNFAKIKIDNITQRILSTDISSSFVN